MSADFRKGLSFVLGISTSLLADAETSTIASKSWDSVVNAQDTEQASSKSDEKFVIRGEDEEEEGKSIGLGGVKEDALSFTIAYDRNDERAQTLENAYSEDDIIAFCSLDGPPSAPGVRGWAGNGEITEWTVTAGSSGVGTIKGKIVPKEIFRRNYKRPGSPA